MTEVLHISFLHLDFVTHYSGLIVPNIATIQLILSQIPQIVFNLPKVIIDINVTLLSPPKFLELSLIFIVGLLF